MIHGLLFKMKKEISSTLKHRKKYLVLQRKNKLISYRFQSFKIKIFLKIDKN